MGPSVLDRQGRNGASPAATHGRSAVTSRMSIRFWISRLLAFSVTCGLWYLGWGLVNESVAGPMAPESVVFYVVLGLLVGVATSATVREFDAESRITQAALAPLPRPA